MDQRTLRVLEYDAIRQRLAGCAACTLGRELALRIEPVGEIKAAARLLEETRQATLMLERWGRPPFGGVTDTRAQVANAGRGGVLTGQDLMEVAGVLYGSRRTAGYLEKGEQDAPLLGQRAGEFADFRDLEETIEGCIDNRGEVMDSASERLQTLRERVRRFQETIARRLQSIIHASRSSRLLQEPIITIRGGRYCVPVRSEYKSEFRGIVHDTSASGATFFMEPFVIVEANNELREARAAEEHEVHRILTRLSGLVGERQEEILAALQVLAELDLVFARAALAEQMKAVAPEINTDGKLELVGARHPLLAGNVVPIDLVLGEEFTALVVTGPNTGGKTVMLKTVGLLTLMAQSGLYVPAQSGSRLAIFRQVFADIGDEQSIQQNLSTFSSHMTQVVNVLATADKDSLVLLDEIGAGTDPAEGSALAKAILLELARRESRVIATTHYGELKVFAYTQPGVENASVLFDPATLEPTFAVRIGAPGSSNAFAIASRLGLSSQLLREAAEMMGESQVQLYEVIQQAEQDQRDLVEERRQAAVERLGWEQTKAEYEALLADFKSKRKDLLRGAREEARQIVTRAKQRTEELLNLLRQAVQEAKEAREAIAREAEMVAQYAPPEPAEMIRAAREELAGISEEAAEATAEAQEEEQPAEEPEAEPAPLGEMSAGAAVLVKSVGERGTVLSGPDAAGEVEVQVGILRLRVAGTDLARVPEQLVTISRSETAPRGSSRGFVPKEVHLRGLRVDAAVYELDAYLNDAAMAHHEEVRVVHGKGTGAVRNAVHERLREHPLVRSFRIAPAGEGDMGVTLVELGPRARKA